MLPLWANLYPSQLTIGLTQDAIVISMDKGLINPVNHVQSVQISQSLGEISTNEPLWIHAIHELKNFLETIQVKPYTKIKIVLGSAFVRYLVLPPQKIHMNSMEKLAYISATYREVYGDVIEHWEIKQNENPPYESSVTAAIDKDLLASIHSISDKHQLKLTSIQPYLICAYNDLADQLAYLSGYLVILESNSLLLLKLEKGNCQNLRIVVCDSHWQIELNKLLIRDVLLTEKSLTLCKILIYAQAQEQLDFSGLNDWDIMQVLPSSKKNAFSEIMFKISTQVESSLPRYVKPIF